ncbi:DUF2971 domain-containing protein [Haladaptatus litoreus]|nr:DUF2971 domain-containing protein [Haladaptatus litoreus]
MSHLNCWHENTSESFAMWDIYLENNCGVAIVSTPSRVKNALQINEGEYLTGKVNYIDYTEGDFNIDSTVTPFFHKRESFQHEREYRILYRQGEDAYDDDGMKTEDFGENIPEGIPVSIDIGTLIEEVVISPGGDDEFREEVVDETRARGFEFPINHSKLTGTPLF